VGQARPFVEVADVAALLACPLRGRVQAAVCRRELSGDFAALALALAPPAGMCELDLASLTATIATMSSTFTARMMVAADAILADLLTLEDAGGAPSLSCVRTSRHDERGLPIAVDVMSFHVDRAPHEVDTYLCTYAGACSEGLEHRDAERFVDDPAVRAALRAALTADGQRIDDDAFNEALADESLDLHYRAKPGAQPWSFGVGALWKLSTLWPGCRVPPTIHRAPPTTLADPPRLLLIA